MLSFFCTQSFWLLLILQSSLEHDVYGRLSTLQEGLIPKKRAGTDDDLHRINELIQVKLLFQAWKMFSELNLNYDSNC